MLQHTLIDYRNNKYDIYPTGIMFIAKWVYSVIYVTKNIKCRLWTSQVLLWHLPTTSMTLFRGYRGRLAFLDSLQPLKTHIYLMWNFKSYLEATFVEAGVSILLALLASSRAKRWMVWQKHVCWVNEWWAVRKTFQHMASLTRVVPTSAGALVASLCGQSWPQ